jgi:Flp pilus assembly protein TadG
MGTEMLRWISRSVGAARGNSRSLLRDVCGASAIEFALIAPAFLAMGMGALKFGVAVSNYMIVTNAAAAGATTFALSRGLNNPYALTVTAITNAAPNLTSANLTKTFAVNGVACTDDSTCSTKLVAAAAATVTVSYPCDLTVMGVNFKTNCTLSSTSAQMVQ